MPLYEFHCQTCDQTFEKLSRMSETEQTCPKCGGSARKTVSVPAKGQMGASSSVPSCAATCGKTSGFG